MADELGPNSGEDSPELQERDLPIPLVGDDEADLTWLRTELAALDALQPTRSPLADSTSAPDQADEPMPDWVWARLTTALAEEAGPTSRAPGWVRWGGGLVAASVAVLAIGLAVTSFSGSGDSDSVVAASSAPQQLKAESASDDADGAAISQPRSMSFAGMVTPALRMVDSETDYTSDGLGQQVADVLTRMDMAPEKARSAMSNMPKELVVPDPEPRGILESPLSLRDCITKLTNLATSTALLIDWSTFDGQEAGVVVTPEYPSPTQPDPSELDIWVVDHECDVKMGVHIRMQ